MVVHILDPYWYSMTDALLDIVLINMLMPRAR
jgi:hypothetical protein